MHWYLSMSDIRLSQKSNQFLLIFTELCFQKNITSFSSINKHSLSAKQFLQNIGNWALESSRKTRSYTLGNFCQPDILTSLGIERHQNMNFSALSTERFKFVIFTTTKDFLWTRQYMILLYLVSNTQILNLLKLEMTIVLIKMCLFTSTFTCIPLTVKCIELTVYVRNEMQ